MGYLDKQGLQRVWDKIKSLFASSLSFSNRTLTLKNKNGDTLSAVELPYRGIYFVKGTQTAATGTWKGALPEVESLYDGLTIAYFLPYAGSGDATLTLTLKNSTTQAEPVYYNNSSRATTHYGAGATVVLTWISNATSGYAAVGSATGRWTRADYNSVIYTSAYCSTGAGTAAKTATCSGYALLDNSYVHVLITNSNTVKSALTLNINNKGAKPIYINGTTSSANNYTLPAGTYIVFYDGTNYYFNTNGNLPGHIDVNTISSVLGVAKGGTGITSNPSMLVNLASTTADTVFEESPRPGVTGTLGIGNGGTGLTASPSMLVKLDSTTADTILKASPRPGITGTLGVSHGGTGQTSAKNAANAFINALDVGNTTPGRNDYIISQYTNGGTTTTTYYRKTIAQLFKVLNFSDIVTALGYEPPIEKALINGSDVFSRPLVTTIRPNKLVLLPADQIIIEETTDGGSTWVDAGYSDDAKRMLFLGAISGHLIKIPLLNGVRSKLCGIRITITAMKYNVPSGTAETSKYNYWNSSYVKSQERYCSLREFYVWCNAVSDKLSMKVEYASGKESTNWITAIDVKNLSGWSGGNVVNWFTDKTFGGNTSQTTNYWNWRMTFFTDGLNGGDLSTSSNTQQQSVSRICGYGSFAWDTPNYLMAHDHLYTWDFNQNATFPAQITATKFNGGAQMTGPLTWKNSTALPAKTSDINYLLTIDGFSDGGTTKYATIANVANAIAPTIETAIENDYTFLTKKTAWEIPEEADLNTYTTPGIYICRDRTRATSLFNSPCQRGFSLTVLATLLDDNDSSISGVIQIVRMFTSHANTLPNQSVYTWQRKLYQNTWSDWTCTSATTAPVFPSMGTDSTSQFTDINFEAAKYGLGSMFHFSSVNGTTTVGNPRASANILQMNYVAATGYDTQLALGQQGKWLSFRGQYQGRWSAWNYVQTLNFGTCTTAAGTAAKTVTLNSHVSATTGTEITILFTNGNQATEPKLTINLPNTTDSAGTTYTGGTCGSNVAIYYQGKPVEPGYIKPGDVVRMIYYSSKWYIVGSINSVTSYGNHILYHIKCTDGNDNNDGLTENTAFKTLDKFFEVTANSGYTDCRCRLDQAGDYYLNKQAANNITWHCRIGPSVTSGDVRIVGNYGVEESWIMYNSHVKLSGRYPKDYKSTDTARIPLQYIGYNPGTLQGIYFENCAVTLENVIFNCTVRTFGCYINATQGLTANRLYLYGSDGIVEDLKIEATSNGTNPAIQVWRGSSVRFSSPNTNNTLDNSNKEFGVKSLSAAATNPKNIFLDIRDSSVVLASKMPQGLTNPYYFGIKCVNAELTGKRAVLGTFQTGCVAGQIAADEETELNVSWGEPAFNSIYGVESVQITTPENTVQIPANAIKTWTIEKATIQTAIKAAHSYSTFPYQILAIIPSFTSDNRVIIKNALEDTSTGNVTVIGRNVSSSAVDVGATATVNILYTLKPLNIIKQS